MCSIYIYRMTSFEIDTLYKETKNRLKISKQEEKDRYKLYNTYDPSVDVTALVGDS